MRALQPNRLIQCLWQTQRLFFPSNEKNNLTFGNVRVQGSGSSMTKQYPTFVMRLPLALDRVAKLFKDEIIEVKPFNFLH